MGWQKQAPSPVFSPLLFIAVIYMTGLRVILQYVSEASGEQREWKGRNNPWPLLTSALFLILCPDVGTQSRENTQVS